MEQNEPPVTPAAEPTATPAKKEGRGQWIAIYILFGISAVLAVFIYIENLPPPAHLYDAFAKCIAETSTTFYGAFWCPHCAEQKAKFGTGAAFLPYHECSTPDGQSQLPSCTAVGIKNYPTWVFPDNSRLVGVQQLSTLASKTGCALPTST